MSRYLLPFLLMVALVLRLAFGLAQDSLQPYEPGGGDTRWYLANGLALVTNAPANTEVHGILTDVSALGQPPVYFVINGLLQVWFSPANAIIALRVLQALLSTLTCYFAYRLAFLLVASHISQTEKRARTAGLIAAGALAIAPSFIIESGQILTETVYIFFVTGGIWLYLEAIAKQKRRTTNLILAGMLLGLATLTRAVFLAFPVVLVVYLLVVRINWRQAALLFAVYALVVLTWTAYNKLHWDKYVIAGTGLDSFIYLGAAGWDDPEAVDERFITPQPVPEGTPEPGSVQETDTTSVPLERDFTGATGDAIMSDVPGYIRRRVGELTNAYLQPHGTTFFGGESLRELASRWLQEDRSLNGFIALTQGDAFWQKLSLYVFHFAALLFGLLGMWRTRHGWRIALPMIGFIAYLTLIHLVLYAVPRYLFPMMVFWWVFAGAGITIKRSAEYQVLSTEETNSL